jgi:hypothetical protein
MSTAGTDPPSTRSGPRRRSRAAAAAAFFSLLCFGAAAGAGDAPRSPQSPARQQPGGQARDPQPPAIGSPAPDIPLFDQHGKESSLREAVRDHVAVLVFYIGYT